MANAKYNAGKLGILSGAIDLTSNTIKCLLVTSAYTPNIDTHEDLADITGQVANGNGYTTGGITLASKTFTRNDTTDVTLFAAADAVWTSATITARGAVIYLDTGVAGTSTLISYHDFGTDVSSTNGTFTVPLSGGIIDLG